MLQVNENTNVINRTSQRNSLDSRMTYQVKDAATLRGQLMGSRQLDRRGQPAVNNLIGAALGTGSEVVLAVGSSQQDLGAPKIVGKTVRNPIIQPNLNGQMTRSWTRHITSAGGGQNLDLPYPGHLPTLGLLKRKKA